MNLNYGDNNLDTLFLIQCSSFWFRSSSEESAQSRIGCSDLGLVQATDDLDELGHHPMWTVLHVITVIDLDFDFPTTIAQQSSLQTSNGSEKEYKGQKLVL